MLLTINGTQSSVEKGITIQGLLTVVQIDPEKVRGIAVALNEKIVRRPDWKHQILTEGDRVEVVTAQQGG